MPFNYIALGITTIQAPEPVAVRDKCIGWTEYGRNGREKQNVRVVRPYTCSSGSITESSLTLFPHVFTDDRHLASRKIALATELMLG